MEKINKELLEALTFAYGVLERGEYPGNTEHDKAIEIARKAIAKAEGCANG